MAEHNPEVCRAEFDRIKERLEKVEEKTDNIAVMDERIKQLTILLEKVASKLDAILDKPAKNWQTVVSSFISTTVGVAVGYFITKER